MKSITQNMNTSYSQVYIIMPNLIIPLYKGQKLLKLLWARFFNTLYIHKISVAYAYYVKLSLII